MKEFKFGLSSLLRLKNIQLESEKTKLSQHLLNEQLVKEAIASLLDERQKAATAVEKLAEIDGSDLKALSAFLVGAAARGTILQSQLEASVRAIKEQRTRVLAAERDVQLLVRIHDKQFAQWKFELDRRIEEAAQESWLAIHGHRS